MVGRMRTLSRPELTAALAARQLLLERGRAAPAEAIRRLTPLQGQDSPAPYVALAARLDGFRREELEAALEAREVVKSTLLRTTLHLTSGDEHPAYHQLARQARLRTWRKRFAHLEEAQVVAELEAFLAEPRSNDEIRERVHRWEGVPDEPYAPLLFARTLLPLVQLPPAGFWRDHTRPRFVVDPRPLPSPADAATHVLGRYLAAFGPASRKDIANWAGVAQRDFGAGFERLRTVAYRDERGGELIDLPGAPLPPADTPLPVRLLARWDQTLLAHHDRERIMPPDVVDLGLTLSGDQTVTVDGRVAASWWLRRSPSVAKVDVVPHVTLRRADAAAIRAEAKATARWMEPEARKVEVAGL